MFKQNRSTANQNLAVFRTNYFNEKQTICHKKTVVELQGILLWHVKNDNSRVYTATMTRRQLKDFSRQMSSFEAGHQ